MIGQLESGMMIANVIIEPIEKIYNEIKSIKSKKRKKAELGRLIHLLEKTRISRTLNAGFVNYLKGCIINYQSKGKEGFIDKGEIDIVAGQIESGIRSLKTIIDEMAGESDKVVIYQNKAWTDLSVIINERSFLINEFKNIKLTKKIFN